MKYFLIIILFGLLPSCLKEEEVIPKDYEFTVTVDSEFIYTIAHFQTSRVWRVDYINWDNTVFASVKSPAQGSYGCGSLKSSRLTLKCVRLTFFEVEDQKCF